EKGTPGFRVGRALDKHGWRSSDTAELIFEDCLVPHDAVLGEEGGGFYAIMKNFQNERTVIGAMAMGEAQAALDLTVDYLKTRRAFGAPPRSRPDGSSSTRLPGAMRRATMSPVKCRWPRPIAAISSMP